MNTPLTFTSRADYLGSGSFDEDGQEIVLGSYVVVAEDENGYRWARHSGSDMLVADPEGINRVEINMDAKQHSEDLADHLNNLVSPNLNPENWFSIDPAYGSVAYDRMDATGFFYDRERQEEQSFI